MMMNKYHIYAGMSGGFGGATYQCTIEAKSEQEAMNYAYQLAEEEYQSYEGSHGIMSWDDCYEDCKDSNWLEDRTEGEIEDIVNQHYLDEIESWTEYYVVLDDGTPLEEE